MHSSIGNGDTILGEINRTKMAGTAHEKKKEINDTNITGEPSRPEWGTMLTVETKVLYAQGGRGHNLFHKAIQRLKKALYPEIISCIFFLFLLVSLDSVSLCMPTFPGTSSVNQVAIKFKTIPHASVSSVGNEPCTTTAYLFSIA